PRRRPSCVPKRGSGTWRFPSRSVCELPCRWSCRGAVHEPSDEHADDHGPDVARRFQCIRKGDRGIWARSQRTREGAEAQGSLGMTPSAPELPTDAHSVSELSCGKPSLDHWLETRAFESAQG